MTDIYTADYIFPVSSAPIKNGAVAVNEFGEIEAVYSEHDSYLWSKPVKKFQGIIVPGFINSHCHLELSHLRGKIKKHGGLISFIKEVINTRSYPPEKIIQAMEQADA